MKDEFHWGKPVPVDIFVMADGEAERPNATKIGGCRYRPKNEAPVTCCRARRSFQQSVVNIAATKAALQTVSIQLPYRKRHQGLSPTVNLSLDWEAYKLRAG